MEYQRALLGFSIPTGPDSASQLADTPLNQGAKKLYTCNSCNKQFIGWKIELRKYCSDKCYRQNITGSGNPFYGKHHSKETRQLISKKVNKGRLIQFACLNCKKTIVDYFSNRSKYCTVECCRLHKQQDNRFNIFTIFNPSSLWVLGMLASDGWVLRDSIAFSGRQEDMEKIKKIFESKNKICQTNDSKKSGKNSCFTFKVSSIALIKKITDEIGIPSNKSLILRYPNIPEDYESTRHFIRGVFDGDGCISQVKVKTTKRVIPYPVATICSGSEIFIKQCIEMLMQFNISSRFYKSKNKISKLIPYKTKSEFMYSLRMRRKKDILKFYDFLYKDVSEDILSEKKKTKFDLMLKEYNNEIKIDYRKFNRSKAFQ